MNGAPSARPAGEVARTSILTDRSVKRTLFGMAFPMLAGTFAMSACNLERRDRADAARLTFTGSRSSR